MAWDEKFYSKIKKLLLELNESIAHELLSIAKIKWSDIRLWDMLFWEWLEFDDVVGRKKEI